MHKNLQAVEKRAQRLVQRTNALGFARDGKSMVIDQARELIAAEDGYRNWHAYRAALATATLATEGALVRENPDDQEDLNSYRLQDNHRGCWVKIGPFVAHLYRPFGDEGVILDLHISGHEDNTLSSAYCSYSDGEGELCSDLEIDIDDVAEWVGLHYHVNFDAETPDRRFDWISRYAESHQDC